MPSLPTPEERDAEYVRWALGGWAGRSGHDAPMVALEALLAAGDSWEELCARAVLHGGDNDSTGTIAAGCWGLRWGLSRVPPGMHRHLEYRIRDTAVATVNVRCNVAVYWCASAAPDPAATGWRCPPHSPAWQWPLSSWWPSPSPCR
mgnify:CR=1 FL=1